MFLHYLTMALRTLWRAPVTALINVLTLSLGLVSFVAAYAIVNYWDNSERHFANADRTYVITASLALRDGSIATGTTPQTNELYARYLPLEFPEFAAVARANPWSRESSITVNGQGARVAALAVDPEFLDIFDLPFVAGDRSTALQNPSGILLSRPAALRLFGRTDVVGETVTLGGGLIDAVVTGVVGDIPEPSHIGTSETSLLRFDLMASWSLYERLRTAVNTPATPPPAPSPASAAPDAAEAAEPAEAAPPAQAAENWLGGYCCTTYVMLEPGSSLTRADLDARLRDFVERKLTPELLALAQVQVGAVPVSEMMVTALNAQLLGAASSTVSITTLLFGLAALVLFVACINYANLATARALRRAREIGLRKALGAHQGQIVFQHLFEAGLLSAAALIVAVLTVYLLAPYIKGAIDIDIRLGLFTGIGFWLFVTALMAAVALLGGGYPAFMLSRVRPVEALRIGRMRAGPRMMATILVGTQFAAASLLVIAVIVMYTQNAALRRTGLGTLEDPYLVVNNFRTVTGVDSELMMAELLRQPQVKGVTQMGSEPWSDNVNLNLLTRTQDPDAPTHTAFWNTVGYDFFDVLDMPVIAGRVFARDRNDMPPQNQDDLSIPRNIVVDRAFAAQLGFATPDEAVGATVYQPSQFGPSRPQLIIGVVENRPLYLRGLGATANGYNLGNPAGLQNLIVRLTRTDVAGGVAAIERAWQDQGARVPLQRRFMDEMFERSYRNFARINQAFSGLAAFALGISLVGLFGMAMQTASRRVHEIGVRKSMGAQTWQILGMLLYAFSKPVVVANVIAWPLAWFAAQAYLSVFIQRIALTPLPFLLSLGFVLVVAWAAVAQQALRAARVNPATVLRFE